MPKIAMIGAGSVVFAKRLITDVLSWPELQDSAFSLTDIDSNRLEMIASLARRMVKERRLPAQIETTLDRREALEGADYVVVTVLIGGLDHIQKDIEIGRRYGIDQAVGDTLGPGGVMRAVRTIPVLLDICADMAELCPQALLINYSNPMAMNCWAISRATKIKAVGLCHSVQHTSHLLAEFVGLPYEEMAYWVAGINHQAWFLRFERKGKSLYPELFAAMDDPSVYDPERVRFEIMRHFGYFVTESTRHMSEYVPYFRRTGELIERYLGHYRGVEVISRYRQSHSEHYAEVQRLIASEEPLEWSRSDEYCSYILHAIETNTPFRINGNVTNSGLITNLPAGCCVEVPCLVDNTGINPCYVGDLPPQLAAINRTNINVQDLAAKGVLEQDCKAIHQAVALDPLTSAILPLDQIEKMTAELLAAGGKYVRL